MKGVIAFRDFEDAVQKHARLVRKGLALTSKVAKNPDDLEAQENLVRILNRLRSLRKRLLETGKGLVDVDDELREDASTLIEYMLLVGIEEERELLTRASRLASRGYQVLKEQAELIVKDKRILDSFNEDLEKIF